MTKIREHQLDLKQPVLDLPSTSVEQHQGQAEEVLPSDDQRSLRFLNLKELFPSKLRKKSSFRANTVVGSSTPKPSANIQVSASMSSVTREGLLTRRSNVSAESRN